MGRAISAEDYKLVSSFESVKSTLLQERFADRLTKPLAYWALPNDRRLPLAFLGRSIGDLLAMTIAEARTFLDIAPTQLEKVQNQQRWHSDRSGDRGQAGSQPGHGATSSPVASQSSRR